MFFKRSLDLIISTFVFILFFPLILLMAILIKFDSKGPIFFKQTRLGYKGTLFKIYKFRTMIDRAWEKGTGLYVKNKDKRITRIGRFLRKYHLDELPQLINVIRGDMSLIGPRPTIPYHYDYYKDWEKVRTHVLPGITGWAQINGANKINWDERIKLDVWYVNNWSVKLDINIFFYSLIHLIGRWIGLKKDTYSDTGPVWTRGRPDSIEINNRR